MSGDLINIQPQKNYLFEKIVEADFKLYQEIFTCSRSTKFIGNFSDEQIVENFSRVLNSKRENYFSVAYSNSKKKFGFIGASYERNAKQAEVGFLFLSKQFLKGAGTDTAEILINHLFKNTELTSIIFKISKFNRPAYIGCLSIGVNFTKETTENVLVGTISRENWQLG